MINKVEICGVNTSKLPVLTNKEKDDVIATLTHKLKTSMSDTRYFIKYVKNYQDLLPILRRTIYQYSVISEGLLDVFNNVSDLINGYELDVTYKLLTYLRKFVKSGDNNEVFNKSDLFFLDEFLDKFIERYREYINLLQGFINNEYTKKCVELLTMLKEDKIINKIKQKFDIQDKDKLYSSDYTEYSSDSSDYSE